MSPLRRAWLLTALTTLTGAVSTLRAQEADTVRRGRVLRFPRDHGAHLAARIEWWYVTGWLGTEATPTAGFQLTFFRSRTGLAQNNRSRFAARHLLFAHAALTRLGPQFGSQSGSQSSPQSGLTGTHLHDQRITRWSGAGASASGHAALDDGA